MTSKVRISAGSFEIEFEGSEEYIKEELPALIELVYSLVPDAEDENIEEEDAVELLASKGGGTVKMTTNTIAAKLGVKSGSDLVLAACAHLALVKGVQTFSRQNILAEMKFASNYYTEKNHRKNLSALLKTLVKNGSLLETEKDTYALGAESKTDLEAKLNAS